MSTNDIRWEQRFQNFSRAFEVLDADFDGKTFKDFSELEQAGLVQHFEVVWELSWKTVKDYLESTGFKFSIVTPRHVLKEAAPAFFEPANIDGSMFMKMLDTRNELSHIYDFEKFQDALIKIEQDYFPQLKKLYLFLKTQVGEDE